MLRCMINKFGMTWSEPQSLRVSKVYGLSLSINYLPHVYSKQYRCHILCILSGSAFKRLKSNMPLAVAFSAAIRAACHPPGDEDLNTAALVGFDLLAWAWVLQFGLPESSANK
jgi:hypothetical protein